MLTHCEQLAGTRVLWAATLVAVFGCSRPADAPSPELPSPAAPQPMARRSPPLREQESSAASPDEKGETPSKSSSPGEKGATGSASEEPRGVGPGGTGVESGGVVGTPGNGGSGDNDKGSSREGKRGGGEGGFDGTRKPVSAGDAQAIAARELERSKSAEAENELAVALRHAARAVQAAEAFPDDPNCAALADSARGRIRVLEKRCISKEVLLRTGPLDRRVIIETP